MVRRVDVQSTVLQAAPTGYLRLLVARRRAAAEHRPLQADVDVLRGQKKVLLAGLAKHLQSPGARLPNRFDPLRGGNMHDEDRAIDELGEPDDALDRLGFRASLVADGVVTGQGVALLEHAPRHPRADAVV